MTEIVIALITAIGSILAVMLTNKSANNKMMQSMHTHQAVTDTKIDELTREVRAHNHFAERMPVVEEQIKVINHRIDDLESYHKKG
jgi:uncharacterized membrane protein YecN with MAPEG domain